MKCALEFVDWSIGRREVCERIELEIDFRVRLIEGVDLERFTPVPVPDFELVESAEVVDEAASQLVPTPEFPARSL
ncbi:MAG: hypothetical protein GY925_01045 [Actinomycetia bacterium]|nr:hypothetical protein [Actinomycetes bacterium]